ncbi:three-helix bundle dimerization domain-containing protein [Rhodococcus sp. I2R]|uniref:three-helix bundle dimerization domain-containing protein n=1 Tax=Rhodococcus sp. I2R TaxID=2855445 RepID=UPI001E621D05|nr:hypothetical protein [Rhodococcus sp. I2R]MCC8930134.1 hypothetical protein [Rhodococcus sp. I2R]
MTTTEEHHIDAVRDRLDAAFPDVPRRVIEDAIAAELARFEGRRVRDFVPLLVERNARESIRSTGARASDEEDTAEDDTASAPAQ